MMPTQSDSSTLQINLTNTEESSSVFITQSAKNFTNGSSTALTSTSDPVLEPADLDIYLIVGAVVCVFGLVLNLVSLTLTARIKKENKRRHTYYLLNLFVCDVVISLSGLVFYGLKIYQLTCVGTDSDHLDEPEHSIKLRLMCAQRATLSVWNAGTTANLFGLTLMSLDLLVAVANSLKHKLLMTRKVVFSMILASWIVSICLSQVTRLLIATNRPLIDDVAEYDPQISFYCKQDVFYDYSHDNTYGKQDHNFVILIIDISVILITFIIILFSYLYISCIIIKVNSKSYTGDLSSTSSTNSRIYIRRRTKGVCTTLIFISSFALLWAPMQTIKLLQLSDSKLLDDIDMKLVDDVTLIIGSFTSIADFVIYFMRSNERKRLSC